MSKQSDKITVLDVSQKPFAPVKIVLEDRGLESIEWLVQKVEDTLSQVGSERPNAADYLSKFKIRVKKLVVGDLEIERGNWRERNVDHFRLLDDPWFILTTRSPALPEGETVVATFEYKSPRPQRSLSVCSGVGNSINFTCGVVEFTDFSPDSLQRRTWSKSAPKWRLASPGLCVEGKCENEKCDANGKMVIISLEFCDFKLPDDTHMCKCPLCSMLVKPVTCGFNNCQWKWNGRKLNLPNPPSCHGQKEWQMADDAYHMFAPKVGGKTKAQWLQLLIITQPATKQHPECSICLQANEAELKVYQCGHKLHTMCFLNHPQHPIGDSDTNTSVCPKCFMDELESI